MSNDLHLLAKTAQSAFHHATEGTISTVGIAIPIQMDDFRSASVVNSCTQMPSAVSLAAAAGWSPPRLPARLLTTTFQNFPFIPTVFLTILLQEVTSTKLSNRTRTGGEGALRSWADSNAGDNSLIDFKKFHKNHQQEIKDQRALGFWQQALCSQHAMFQQTGHLPDRVKTRNPIAVWNQLLVCHPGRGVG